MKSTASESKTPGEILKEIPLGGFQTIAKIKGAGALEARRLVSGVSFSWRVTVAGKTERYSIGMWDSSAPPLSLSPTPRGYSLQAAIAAADVLASQHKANLTQGGYPALLIQQDEEKRQAAQAAIDAQVLADAAQYAAETYNLKALLNDYCNHLEALGRRSHTDARSIFKLHVIQAWPQLAALPANEITGEQVADTMRLVIESGKARTANKLRSYMRAAFQTALAARSKDSIPLRFKAYKVRSNPASDTMPDESANKPDKHPLSGDELRTYWQAIKPMPGFIGAVLRLHLLTGGQRIEQLVNLLTSNVTSAAVILFDGKGRPGKAPRPHTVPLIEAAARALRDCHSAGAFALSTDGGKSHISAITLSHWAVTAGAGITDFQTKRIRSGVETLLASVRVSSDIRGRLQSHGISGVQARHYDGHDYMDEKRHALETLFNLLEGRTVSTNNVIAFRAA